MRSSRSIQERVDDKQAQLDKLMKKAKQYEAQIKQLEARQKDEERRKRTHRLIQVGATVEAVLGYPIEEDDLPLLTAFLKATEKRHHSFTSSMHKTLQYDFEDEDIADDDTEPDKRN